MLFFSPVTDQASTSKAAPFFGAFRRFQPTSFAFLNLAQFLGAMNDNIFKLLIVYCFITVEGVQASNTILALVGTVYVIPFLLFSQTAGMMADRFSKREIILWTKVLELIVMLFGIVAFIYTSKLLSFTGLFLLATHSAIFGPCKYGIVPEIVPQESISRANGFITSFTYSAIIIGTFLASFLTEITDRNFVLSISVCAGFSAIGLYASLKIQKTAASNPTKKVSPRFITELVRALRIIRKEPSLLTAVIGSAFFLFVGSFMQLNMIPYAIHVLNLSDVQGGYLFLLTSLGIGAGSLLAGKLSGKAVELGLVPLGGIGITTCCFLLDAWSSSFPAVVILVLLVGFFGGVYLVPLDSYIQVASPKQHRGQVVATTNFLGFFGVLLSAGTLYLLNEVLHFGSDHAFTIIGFVTLVIVVCISISMSGYIVRFFSFIVSRIHFPVKLQSQELISLTKVSFFFVPHPFWPWAAVLLASQRKRMRLFSVGAENRGSLACRMAKMLIPVIGVDSPEALLPQGEFGNLIHHSIYRGTSIGIFCSRELLTEYTRRWMAAWNDECKDADVSFFALVAIGREELDDGKLTTELAATITKLS